MLTLFKNQSLLDEFFNESFYGSSSSYNWIKTENGYSMELLVPGYNKNNLSIEVDDGQLFVKGDRNKEKSESNYRSLYYNSINKVFNLPDDVDEDNIDAEIVDGILKVNFPFIKKKKQKRKVIDLI